MFWLEQISAELPNYCCSLAFNFFLCYVWVVCVNYCSNSKFSFPEMRFVSRHRFTPQLCLHKSMPWLTNYNKGKNDVQHDAQPIPVWITHGFYQRLVCCFYQRFFHFAELWRKDCARCFASCHSWPALFLPHHWGQWGVVTFAHQKRILVVSCCRIWLTQRLLDWTNLGKTPLAKGNVWKPWGRRGVNFLPLFGVLWGRR